MKPSKKWSITLILILLSVSTAAANPVGNDVAIDQVVSQVKTALADVATKLQAGALPQLKSVTLDLQTVASKQGGISIKLWVITIGHTWTKENSQDVTIVLTPPSPGNAVPVATETLTKELEDAIISAAQGVKDAGAGSIPLNFTTLTVELGFTITGDTTGSGSVTITPVTAEFSGDLKKTAVHKITVVFSKT